MAGLQRFVDAQADVYETALAELRAGRKRSHWMWFVFPQLAGLGRSPTAQFYAIADAGEARDYLAHPVLGARLRECAATAIGAGRDAQRIFGSVDAMKLRSSMTLFAHVEPAGVFDEALDRFFAGAADAMTLELLGR